MPRMEDNTLAVRVHEALLERGETVATAESLTGGGVGRLLSSVAGSSERYRGGVVSYATDVKRSSSASTTSSSRRRGRLRGVRRQKASGCGRCSRRRLGGEYDGRGQPDFPGGEAGRHRARGGGGPRGVRASSCTSTATARAVRAGTERVALPALLDAVVGDGR